MRYITERNCGVFFSGQNDKVNSKWSSLLDRTHKKIYFYSTEIKYRFIYYNGWLLTWSSSDCWVKISFFIWKKKNIIDVNHVMLPLVYLSSFLHVSLFPLMFTITYINERTGNRK